MSLRYVKGRPVTRKGGRLQEPWWRQASADKQLRFTLEEISAEARERWQR